MRFRRGRGSDRRRQDNGRRNASGNGNFRPHRRDPPPHLQGNSSGLTHATSPQSRLTPLHPRVPSRGPPPRLQGNSPGLTHATSPQSRLTPLHPRVPSRGPPPHLQSNSSGLTHATSPQSRLTPLHPRVPSRGPPSHLQGNSSELTHTTRRRSPDSPPCTLECPWSWSSLGGSHHAMAMRSRVTPTRTLGTQVRSRYNLLLPRFGPKTVPRTTVYGTTSRILPPVNTNTKVTYTGPTLRPCHLYHASDPAVSARTDPLTGTIIQRCGETCTRGTDIRVLYTPHTRPPYGRAAPGMGSSGFSAGLVSLPAIHELPLDDSNGDADSDAHPPCPLQIGVCPQSRQTTDLGTPTSQLTAVGHTQDCAATRTAAVIPHHFLDAENAFLNSEEYPAHSLWASCSEPPAPRHNTNATADLSASYGTAATLGQHKTCPDRDDSERARSVTTPPFLSRMTSAPLSSHLNTHMSPMTHPFIVDLVEYNCAE